MRTRQWPFMLRLRRASRRCSAKKQSDSRSFASYFRQCGVNLVSQVLSNANLSVLSSRVNVSVMSSERQRIKKATAIVTPLALILLLSVVMNAQQNQIGFDVAVIKPNNSGRSGSNTTFPPGGRFSATNVWLKLLIRWAYGLPAYQVVGGEDWTSSLSRFDVEAKAEGNPSHKQVLDMLQTLLTEQFKLRFHWITKEDAAYTLVLAKGGPKFKAAPADGTAAHTVETSRGAITAKNGEMSRFVWFLAQILDRPVVDKTGLNGFYDFTFELPSTILPSPDSVGPTIFDALEDQLGLKLQAGKGPVQFFVIDHAERPSAN